MKISLLSLATLCLSTPPYSASAAFCCSWDYKTCGTAAWCNGSESNCEGACHGEWIDPSNTPTIPGDHCCSWDQQTCGTNPYCNAKESNCSVNCNGVWITTSSSGGGGGGNPVPQPAPSPPAPTPVAHPTPTIIPGTTSGELTWWTGSEPGPLEGSSCGYASTQATATTARAGATTTSWLIPYVQRKMYCAVSEDLFAQGVGCGKCYHVVYNGVGGTNPAQAAAGRADIQVVNSGAGGSKHFDCFHDAFYAITGISTGVFPVSYSEIPCKSSPVTAVVLDGNNAWYVKVLLAGGTTGIAAATITIGGNTVAMQNVVGATWSASLSGGLTNVPVRYDITFDNGSNTTLANCHNSIWPVATGSQCGN